MTAANIGPAPKQLLGHPVGLYVLFMTEMWERFSYYGMRAMLILYLTVYLQMSDKAAGGIYGDYTGLVYLTPLLGGFLSDRYLGLQRAILIGAATMAVGQFCLMWHAWPSAAGGGAGASSSLGMLYIGLLLMILGNGFFKPNITTIVGKLYERGDVRRESAFSIFYMGVNVGALSPLIVSYLAEKVSWHYGFMACGVGMVLGVIVFALGRGLLGSHGLHPEPAAPPGAGGVSSVPPLTGGQKLAMGIAALPGLLCAAWFAMHPGTENASLVDALRATMWPVIFSICVCMYVLLKIRCTREEMKKVNVIFILGGFVLFFWAAFEQAGSSLNLFAERYTRLDIVGFTFPAGWFQWVNPLFIILLAPVFAAMWPRLARVGKEPSTPAKMSFGMFANSAAYVLMMIAMVGAASGQRVGPWWLVGLYFLQTCGELCLSPVGLSMVTKLAPVRFGAMLMGVWFLANAWANKLAGVGAGYLEPLGPSLLFKLVAAILAGVGLVLVFCVPYLKRQMGDVN